MIECVSPVNFVLFVLSLSGAYQRGLMEGAARERERSIQRELENAKEWEYQQEALRNARATSPPKRDSDLPARHDSSPGAAADRQAVAREAREQLLKEEEEKKKRQGGATSWLGGLFASSAPPEEARGEGGDTGKAMGEGDASGTSGIERERTSPRDRPQVSHERHRILTLTLSLITVRQALGDVSGANRSHITTRLRRQALCACTTVPMKKIAYANGVLLLDDLPPPFHASCDITSVHQQAETEAERAATQQKAAADSSIERPSATGKGAWGGTVSFDGAGNWEQSPSASDPVDRAGWWANRDLEVCDRHRASNHDP